jgi:hypothetical protein
MFEGVIRDSPVARKALTWLDIGTCLEIKFERGIGEGDGGREQTLDGVPTNLRICAPGQSGFSSSYVYGRDLPRFDTNVPKNISSERMRSGW